MGWRCSMMGRRPSVVRWGSSGVHAWWRGPRMGSGTLGSVVMSGARGLSLPLGLSGGGSCSGSLLLHLLPCLHLCVLELLHVERLSLCEELLPLKLQLQGDEHEVDRKNEP